MTKKRKSKKDFADILTSAIGTKNSLIVHTICFISVFALMFFGFSLDQVLLLLTTTLSIEAIYLAIFIQITVNKNTQSLQEVEQDIDEIQEDVEDDDEHDQDVKETLETIERSLTKLHQELEVLKKRKG